MELTLALRRRPRAIFLVFSVFLILTIYLFRGSSHLSRAVIQGRFQFTDQTRNATMSAGVDAIRVPATGVHSASIIWLHGLGDTGQGWRFLSKQFDLPVYRSPSHIMLTN